MVPTYVGVILSDNAFLLLVISGPHVCGGDPNIGGVTDDGTVWSPRMWG